MFFTSSVFSQTKVDKIQSELLRLGSGDVRNIEILDAKKNNDIYIVSGTLEKKGQYGSYSQYKFRAKLKPVLDDYKIFVFQFFYEYTEKWQCIFPQDCKWE